MITGAFSITRQAIQLGLLPRLAIRHTSESMAGQIYLPRVNWILCAGVVRKEVPFMVISVVFAVQPRVLEAGTSSVSSLIALKYGEATPFATSALMAAGLSLFLMTLVINFSASAAIARSRSGAVSDG